MKKALLAAMMAAATVATLVPAHSAEQLYDTQTYDFSSVGLSLTGGANIGGVRFGAPGFTPTRVVVRDELGLPVSLIVGQDFNGNSLVGETGEPRAVGCGTVDMSTTKVAWDPSKDISVFVQTAAAACVGAVGTTGQVDLYVDVIG